MKLGFIILAHNQPDAIRRLTEILAVGENHVVVHFDTGATSADKKAVREIAAANPERVRVISKVHCVWGEWSLVEAVLLSLREFGKMAEPPDYIHLMSGADFPIRPISDLKEFLRRNPDRDYIECCDITWRPWVKGGLGRERFEFYFPFNFRTSRNAFDRMVRWHRKLKIRRKMPLHLIPNMGSQWWTLRWSTCAKVLEFTAKHPELPKFFRKTWIPDESYFQTLIAKLVPKSEIADLQLMFHQLTPTGRPYVFYNDHLPLVRKLPHFFIRKVSPHASDLFGIPDLPVRPRRPIPKERHLARARDLVRARIDANHEIDRAAPGYLDPAPKPGEETVVEAIKRPVLLYLLTDERLLPQVAEITRTNPAYSWLGRPFAPGHVAMPDRALERVGMTEKSWKLRDAFIRDFLCLIADSPSDSEIPVAAMIVPGDSAHLGEIGRLQGLLPMLVSDVSPRPHQRSRMAGMLHEASPGLSARVVHASMEEVSVILDDFAKDPPW